MTRKKQWKNDFDISDFQLESLARVLLPIMQEYLSSEEGKRDYAEWTANKQKQLNNKNLKKEKSH